MILTWYTLQRAIKFFPLLRGFADCIVVRGIFAMDFDKQNSLNLNVKPEQ